MADLIFGVKAKELKIIADERGRLMEILRSDDQLFEKFGQVYMTTCRPGYTKAWHYHKIQSDNFTCINGSIRLVLYDSRKNSPTAGELNKFIISLNEPKIVHIPKLVFHGFEAIGKKEAVVINLVTEPYNHKKPDEYKIDPFKNDIPYKWAAKKGG